jgi:hypothetical protein
MCYIQTASYCKANRSILEPLFTNTQNVASFEAKCFFLEKENLCENENEHPLLSPQRKAHAVDQVRLKVRITETATVWIKISH